MGKILSLCLPSNNRPDLDDGDHDENVDVSYNDPVGDSSHYRSYGATDNPSAKDSAGFAPASSDSSHHTSQRRKAPPPPQTTSYQEPEEDDDQYDISPDESQDYEEVDVGTLKFPGRRTMMFDHEEIDFPAEDFATDNQLSIPDSIPPPDDHATTLPPRPDSMIFSTLERPQTMLFENLSHLPPPEENEGIPEFEYSDTETDLPEPDHSEPQNIPETTNSRLSTSSAPLPPPDDDSIPETDDTHPKEENTNETSLQNIPETNTDVPISSASDDTRPMSFLNFDPIEDDPQIHSFDTLKSRNPGSSISNLRDSALGTHPRANTLSLNGSVYPSVDNNNPDNENTDLDEDEDILSGVDDATKTSLLTDQPVQDSSFADLDESIFDTVSSLQSENQRSLHNSTD